MRRKAFTLVEVLIAMMLIAIITAAFFPGISNGVQMIFEAKKFTEETFKGQTEVEQEILKLNSGNDVDWESKNVSLFGQNVPLKTKTLSLSNSHQVVLGLSEERAFIPELPEIDKVTLTTSDNNVFSGLVTYKKNKAGDNWEQHVEFCVYRWYLADLSYIGKDFNIEDRSALSLFKEYNPVREDGNGPLFDKEEHFSHQDSEKKLQIQEKKYTIIAGGKRASMLSIIPNTKSLATNEKTRDEFWKNSLNLKKNDENNFTEEEMKLLYANKGIVFSATPIAKETGLVGPEKFSQMLSLKYENPSVLKDLSLGIVEIPATVGDTHLLEGVVALSSEGTGVKGKKIKVSFLLASTNEEIDKQEIVTNEEGYALFSRQMDTNTSYLIRAEVIKGGESDPDLSVEGVVDFKTYDLMFVDVEPHYKEGSVVILKVKLIDSSGKPVKGSLVRYQVKNNSGKVVHKSSIYTDKSGIALLRTGQRNKGEYEITATVITPSGKKLTAVQEFIIQ